MYVCVLHHALTALPSFLTSFLRSGIWDRCPTEELDHPIAMPSLPIRLVNWDTGSVTGAVALVSMVHWTSATHSTLGACKMLPKSKSNARSKMHDARCRHKRQTSNVNANAATSPLPRSMANVDTVTNTTMALPSPPRIPKCHCQCQYQCQLPTRKKRSTSVPVVLSFIVCSDF